jgi:hypothetical protein
LMLFLNEPVLENKKDWAAKVASKWLLSVYY